MRSRAANAMGNRWGAAQPPPIIVPSTTSAAATCPPSCLTGSPSASWTCHGARVPVPSSAAGNQVVLNLDEPIAVSIDPVVFFTLQLVLFFEATRSERQLTYTNCPGR